MKILVIDNDPLVLELYQRTARELDHEIIECRSAVAAFESFGAHRYQMVILDLQLPDNGGFEICRWIRSQPEGQDTIVWVTTAQSTSEVLRPLVAIGADNYLAKPIDPTNLRIHLSLSERQVHQRIIRRTTESKLKESESQLRELFAKSSDLIQILTMNQHFLYANNAWIRTLGYNEAELKELSAVDIVHPDERTRFKSVIDGLSHVNTQAALATTLIAKDGRSVFVEGSLYCETRNGKAVRIRGFFHDISSRQQAELALQDANDDLEARVQSRTVELQASNERLRHSELYLRKVIDLVPHMIFAKDEEGCFVLANQTMADAYGRTVQELIGKSQRVIHSVPQEIEQMLRDDREVLATGLPKFRSSQEFTLTGGDKRMLQISKIPLMAADDGKGTVLGVAVDITELKRIERELTTERSALTQRVEERTSELQRLNTELARASKLKDQFLANMSHELRTPLNTILGVSEALQEMSFGELNNEQVESISRIERTGKHLSNLINDILDLAKIGAGDLQLEYSDCDLKVVCEAALLEEDQLIRQKEINLHTAFDDNSVIQGDEYRLIQIVKNLINNAVKFTPAGGRVSVTTMQDGDDVIIQVSDSGIGIESHRIDSIFKPFEQLDVSLARRFPGIGLGLTLVHNLVNIHRGTIAVTSIPNERTDFSVRLPKRSASADPASSTATKTPQTTDDKDALFGSILLITDQEATIAPLKRLLRSAGTKIHSALSDRGYPEELDLIPDLLVLDVGNKSNIQRRLIQAWRSKTGLPHLPVLVFIDHDTADDSTPDELLIMVHKPLSRSNVNDALQQLAQSVYSKPHDADNSFSTSDE